MTTAVIHDAQSGKWLSFEGPAEIVVANELDQVLPALRRVEELVRLHQWYAVGFLSYESAPAFDSAFVVRPALDFPLVWFALFRACSEKELVWSKQNHDYTLGSWVPSITQKDYDAAISAIKKHLACGNSYQVNFTYRLRSSFSGNAWKFFGDLVEAQRQAKYCAYIELGRYIICSASPELFFCADGKSIVSRPMKGTASRGRTLREDQETITWLKRSSKNRAENIMIVDMIRNDLARISKLGTVSVSELFQVERYPTLLQMISTVTSESSASLSEILETLFPCASITGAPKARTTEIIAELENEPRRSYTGAVGFLTPELRSQFNVAIRTALIDTESEVVEYGAGGGIVWDSLSTEEYCESKLKTRVLNNQQPEFSLLETMRWTAEGSYFLLDRHLQRLLDSAEYFSIPVTGDQLRAKLKLGLIGFGEKAMRVRLLVNQQGEISLQAFPLEKNDPSRKLRLALAEQPVDSSNPFLFHKTTARQVYDDALALRSDCDDVLLFNERGELTESCYANLVMLIDGALLTPAANCGLLPGTYRAWLLEQGIISEEVLKLELLRGQPERIYLINSVRKWRDAEIVEGGAGAL